LIQELTEQYLVRLLCKMMGVHPSGFYAWSTAPESARAIEDRRLLGRIKESWLESGAVYGYWKVTDDLRELGEQCSTRRVQRLMRTAGLRSQTGYAKRKSKRDGAPALIAPNHLQRQLDVREPNRVWVTDITYIRAYEGWLYLAAVLDLFSPGHRVVHAFEDRPGTGHERLADGRLAPPAKQYCAGAFGSG
jgi:putative transposase